MEKRPNIHVTGATGQKRGNESETIFNKKLTETLPRLIKTSSQCNQEVLQIRSKINIEGNTPGNIIVKLYTCEILFS